MVVAIWKSSTGKTLRIERHGRPVALGGRGILWKCPCGTVTKGRPCGHLLSLWHRTYKKEKVTVTAEGKKVGLKAPLPKAAIRKVMAKRMAGRKAATKVAPKSAAKKGTKKATKSKKAA